MVVRFTLNGNEVAVDDDGGSLLEVLRDRLGVRSPKDGCSPQGQCGCCTVLINGAPRVACVTPARRVAGRAVTTLEGLPADRRAHWADAFVATGASQCGFCTPGIIMRLEAGGDLKAHLCRCTGWRTILDAAEFADTPRPRDYEKAALRAAIEGHTAQAVGTEVVLGEGGFAADTAPLDALVAVSDGAGGWAVGETLMEAREAAGKVQGRKTSLPVRPALEVPSGDWYRTLRTSWVEPAYLEFDTSWCEPGGEPYSPLANGGAFGAKLASSVPAAARRLADECGRTVVASLSREDAVRLGPKRPPIAAGVREDGSGVIRVAATAGYEDLVASELVVEHVDLPGPPTTLAMRAAGWAEAALLLGTTPVSSPDGATAEAAVSDERIVVRVECGEPLDEVVLRSYCIGAAHMALGWITSEGLAVDESGEVHDLTIRSFGILRAADTPPIDVEIIPSDGAPVNGSDAVFAAVAGAVWRARGCPQDLPTGG